MFIQNNKTAVGAINTMNAWLEKRRQSRISSKQKRVINPCLTHAHFRTRGRC